METPIVPAFTSDEASSVYEPAEDSFLLIDALEKELESILSRKPTVCLEIGSGSGIVSTAVARALGNTCCFLTTDINPRAAEMTKRTGQRNGANIEPVLMDLAGSFLGRLDGQVDLLVFNPPYVVTASEEVRGSQLTRSWAGGKDGREVIDRFNPLVPKLLSPRGLYFLLVIKENNPDEICQLMAKAGLKGEVVISRRCGAEFLKVLCFHK
uniref:Methyltransferase HEMK2 n=1 Tax=Ixodes ricinus TaxID=34613 RepID=A0A0K8RKS1_IXORI